MILEATPHDSELLSTSATPDDLRQAMSRQACGVNVVTNYLDGRPWGLTVSAFCSVCLDPPTVLVCLNKESVTAKITQDSGLFAVNLLNRDQLHISKVCSKSGEPKFIDNLCKPPSELPEEIQSPVIDRSLVTFDCSVEQITEVGTHVVVIGRVRSILAPRSEEPLVYANGKYILKISSSVPENDYHYGMFLGGGN